jgi:exonuclease VII large subunit
MKGAEDFPGVLRGVTPVVATPALIAASRAAREQCFEERLGKVQEQLRNEIEAREQQIANLDERLRLMNKIAERQDKEIERLVNAVNKLRDESMEASRRRERDDSIFESILQTQRNLLASVDGLADITPKRQK